MATTEPLMLIVPPSSIPPVITALVVPAGTRQVVEPETVAPGVAHTGDDTLLSENASGQLPKSVWACANWILAENENKIKKITKPVYLNFFNDK